MNLTNRPNTPTRILALETSGDVCGVALAENGAVVAEHTFQHRMRLSERLMGLVDAIFEETGVGLRDVDAFAVGVGPGSFTGTRIGVMTAKTWAHILKRPLFGVNSLEALAWEYVGLAGVTVMPLLHCRPGVVYAAVYEVGGNIPVSLALPVALPLAELLSLFPNGPPDRLLLCGDAPTRYADELPGLLPGAELAMGGKTFPRVAAVAALASRLLAQGDNGADPLELAPLYLAPPPISKPKVPIPQPLSTD